MTVSGCARTPQVYAVEHRPCPVCTLHNVRRLHLRLPAGNFPTQAQFRFRLLRLSRLRGPCAAIGQPSNVAEVLQVAREQLYAETDHRRPDYVISLAKACLLIALEEEAAADQELLKTSSSTATWLETLIDDVQPTSVNKEQHTETAPRTIGSAPSWSLARLVSLADEVKTCFVQQHALQTQSFTTPNELPPVNPASTPDQHPSDSTGSTGSSNSISRSSNAASPKQTTDAIAIAMHQYPTQAIAALNTVLFERHGYHRMLLHGNPRDAQLNNVLDYGSGTPVALAILYMEVARRAGYPMVGCPLEGDKQFLVWPQNDGLKVGGAEFVIDPYSQGALYSTEEVAELFDLGHACTSGLQPASKRQILAALLASLRDAHWAQAVSCFPEPGLMVPISLPTAASGSVQPMHGYHMQRALAAAERRFFLLPNTRHVHLEYALLLYFANRHEAAAEELLTYKAQDSPDSQLHDHEQPGNDRQQEFEQLGIVLTRLQCVNL